MRPSSVKSPQGLCLISLSNNSDHQNTTLSMFNALEEKYRISTVCVEHPIIKDAPRTSSNHYVACPNRPGIGKGTFNVGNFRRLIRVVRDTGCRTIYFESVHLWNLFLMLALGRGYTFIQTLHDVIPHDNSKAVYLCQKLLCRFADLVVIKSPTFLEEAKRLYNLSESKLQVFGVWRAYPDKPPAPCQGNFLFFGRLRKYKGLASIEQIVRACPSIVFELVGEPDDESRSLAERIAGLPNVEAELTSVDDEKMAEYFSEAGWILLPYESASQSGVIIDAYRFGKPVIAFAVGAVSLQVVDDETGFLISPGNVDGFVEAVQRAKDFSSSEYDEFSRGAFEFGKRNYSAHLQADAFAAQFNIEKKNVENR